MNRNTWRPPCEALGEIGPLVLDWPCPFVLSATGWQQVPYQGSPATYGNCIALGPPNLRAVGILFNGTDYEEGPTPVPLASRSPLYVQIKGEGGVDMNDTRSIYVILHRPLEEGETVDLVMERAQGVGDAQFLDGDAQNKKTIRINQTGIIWLEGKEPSGQNDGKNFKITVKINGNLQETPKYTFRVFNTQAAFGNIGFLPIGGGAPATEPKDPYILIDPRNVAPTSGRKENQRDYDWTFLWDPEITIRNAPNDDTAEYYEVGITQNLINGQPEAFYVGNKKRWYKLPYLPMLDTAKGEGPYYGTPTAYGHFTKKDEKITLNMKDGPWLRNWAPIRYDGRAGDPALQFVERNQEFRTWIVVRFIKDGDPDKGATKRIYHVDWNLEYNLKVDLTQNPIAFPNPNKVNRARIVANGNGSPKMITVGPTCNVSHRAMKS